MFYKIDTNNAVYTRENGYGDTWMAWPMFPP